MFDTKTSFAGRLTDAVDLLLDFATLGEYGLEPVERSRSACESRRREAGRGRARRSADSRLAAHL
jgi:hypothetical protein